ncbi:hypothetical protein WMY93_008464 [Mugilogobius chulae]|uniref:T-complex protein 1 subunit theta n=1 Tax=Mugilogobius chulae TaxID=88201 RepID=A0AAW0PMF8_9GOBI
MDGVGKAMVGVWRAHTTLDESDAESSPEAPDRFRKQRSSSSLNSLRMSLRKRLPLRTVQTNSLPENPTWENLKQEPKPSKVQKLTRSARNSITEVYQKFQRTREFSREDCLVATPGRICEDDEPSTSTSHTPKRTPRTATTPRRTPRTTTPGRTPGSRARKTPEAGVRGVKTGGGRRQLVRMAALRSPFASPNTQNQRNKFDNDLESVSTGLRRLKHLSRAFDELIGRDDRTSSRECCGGAMMRKLDPSGKLCRSNLTRRATNVSNSLGGWAQTAVNTIRRLLLSENLATLALSSSSLSGFVPELNHAAALLQDNGATKHHKMALHVPKAPGFAQMLKDGAKHYSGLEEAVLWAKWNEQMVINHLEKLFVTNDAATILRELEVQHPAAKMVVMASHMQEQEVGDGTNFVLVFAGALLELAEELLRMGLSVSEVIEGYEKACKKAQEILPECVCSSAANLHDIKETTSLIRPAVMSKQYGNEDFLANLIAQACVSIFPESGNFNVDNVRVCKILGCGVTASSMLHGMVFKKEAEGDVTSVKDAKIAVFSCPFDCTVTETKGTVLINNAKELMDFSRGEEDMMEAQVKAIKEAGANVVVTGGKVADMALHYANKYKLMVVRLNSKWDLRRLCKTVGAVALPKMTAPTPDEMGHCDSVYLTEVGDTQVVVFKHEKEDGAISTVVIRGSTDNLMDDIERAVDDGVNTFKVLVRDKRLLPGAGATEIELAKQLASYGESCPGLEQYAIKKFAEAFEALPRALAENSGVKASELISKMYAAHHEGNKNMGFDIEGDGPSVKDMVEAGILEPFLVKHWGIKLATNAAITVLRVDQIIMAKPAGGPKPPQDRKDFDEDD